LTKLFIIATILLISAFPSFAKPVQAHKKATAVSSPVEKQEATATKDDGFSSELVVHLGESDDQITKASNTNSSGDTLDAKAWDKMTPKEQAQKRRQMEVTQKALSCRGDAYVWGGNGRGGFDCSGFTAYLYSQRGIKLPHSAKAQFNGGESVAKEDLSEGDLVFFNTSGPISHVGIYIGNGKFVHAANPRRGVVVESLSSKYYSKCYAGARRYSK
jgi:cell wall-associated NlpC family hydrolase